MNLKSMTLPELTAVIKELRQPAFRGKQVYSWLHKGVRALFILLQFSQLTLRKDFPHSVSTVMMFLI